MKISHAAEQFTPLQDIQSPGKSISKGIYKYELSPARQIQVLEAITLLLDAGYSLNEGWGIIAKEADSKNLRFIFNDIEQILQRGSSLGIALQQYPKLFSYIIIDALYACEISGTITSAMPIIVAVLKKSLIIQRQRRNIYFHCPMYYWSKAKKYNAMADFANTLHVLLAVGLPLSQALITLEVNSTRTRKEMIAVLREEIERGVTLHSALEYFPKHFEPFFIHLVAKGEEKGMLSSALEKACEHYLERCSAWLS